MRAEDDKVIETLVEVGVDPDEAAAFVEDHGTARAIVWLRSIEWAAVRRPSAVGEA